MTTRQVDALEWMFFILCTIATAGGKIWQKELMVKAGSFYNAKNPEVLCTPTQITIFSSALEFLKRTGLVNEIHQKNKKFFCSENGLQRFVQSWAGVEKRLREMQARLEERIRGIIREEAQKVIEESLSFGDIDSK